MLIPLTDANSRAEFYLYSDMIRVVQQQPRNQMLTLVVTNIVGPQGPLAYEVLETPATIAALVNGHSLPREQTPPKQLLQG